MKRDKVLLTKKDKVLQKILMGKYVACHVLISPPPA